MPLINCFGTAALILILSLGLFCSQGSSSTVAERTWMPSGLEYVRLGMSKDELSKLRPNLLKKDTGKDYLFEETRIGNNFFGYVSYEFDEERLSKVTLSQAGDPVQIRSKCPGLFKGGIKKWGDNYSQLVGIIENHPITKLTYLYPVLYWQKSEANIVVRCVITSDQKYLPNFYSLTIFSSKSGLSQSVQMKFKDTATKNETTKVFDDFLTETTKEPLFR